MTRASLLALAKSVNYMYLIHVSQTILGPFIWRKFDPRKRVNLPAESTLERASMRRKLTSARACSDRPALIKFAQLGERRFLNGKKFARLRG